MFWNVNLFRFVKIIVAQMTNVDVKIVFWTITQAIDNEWWMDRLNYLKLLFEQFLITGGIRSIIKWVFYFIFCLLDFCDISIWWCNFFGSQAKKLNLSSSLSLTWLINQARPSQAQAFWYSHELEFKHCF